MNILLHSAPSIHLSARRERELAMLRMAELEDEAYKAGNKVEARWYEKCFHDLATMTDEEFHERYKDIDD